MANAAPDFMLNLQKSLVNSSNFQTWTGTASPALAAANVFYQEVLEADIVRPCALIFMEDGDDYGEMPHGQGAWADSGTVQILFETDGDPSGTDEADRWRKAFTDIQGIMRDVAGQSGDAERLIIRSWKKTNPARPPERDGKAGGETHWLTIVAIDWGLES